MASDTDQIRRFRWIDWLAEASTEWFTDCYERRHNNEFVIPTSAVIGDLSFPTVRSQILRHIGILDRRESGSSHNLSLFCNYSSQSFVLFSGPDQHHLSFNMTATFSRWKELQSTSAMSYEFTSWGYLITSWARHLAEVRFRTQYSPKTIRFI